MIGVGIVGGKERWVRVTYDSISLALTVSEQVSDLWLSDEMTFVDVPLRLGTIDEPERACDHWMRETLQGRAHTVQTPPVQEVLSCQSYEEAKSLQPHGLSEQAWELVSKIREFQRTCHESSFESNPEICFAVLNGSPAQYDRDTPEGVEERMTLLRRYSESTPWNWKMSHVHPVEIVDAALLAVAAYEAAHGFVRFMPNGIEAPAIAVPDVAMRS